MGLIWALRKPTFQPEFQFETLFTGGRKDIAAIKSTLKGFPIASSVFFIKVSHQKITLKFELSPISNKRKELCARWESSSGSYKIHIVMRY